MIPKKEIKSVLHYYEVYYIEVTFYVLMINIVE
jgi:hypothetical protein